MAIGIGIFLAPDAFKDLVDRLIDELKSSPPLEGSAGIFMPGEMEYLKERDYLKSGIPVFPEVFKTLDAFAQKIGIAPVPR
jgi:LDH2 family malate/lactate/ureidoglycolate dehydrogenase